MSYCIGLDPGAHRFGVAYLQKRDEEYRYISSFVVGVERQPNEPYGEYRIRLIEYWARTNKLYRLLGSNPVGLIVNERIPATHSRVQNSTQMLLGHIVLASIHIHFLLNDYIWKEVGANTVKKHLTGDANATKTQVRNAVIQVFPELEVYKKEWAADQWDAIAIGLVGLGYKNV